MSQWYMMSDGQQLGPYSGEQMQQYATEGRIAPESLVWAEGMAEWAQASQVPGLLPQAATAKPATTQTAVAKPSWAPPGARPASTASPYATPQTSISAAPTGGAYPMLPIKAASFGLWMWTFIGVFLTLILAIVFAVMGATSTAAPGADPSAAAMPLMLAGLMYLACIACMVVSSIFFLINIYRAWSCLAAGVPSTSPGKAIGFLFIPFFNLYWIFVAIAGLPKDWNRIVSSYEDLHNAPRMSEGVFLMYSIGSIIFPPLSLIVIFPMMSQICNGINFFAYRRNTAGTSGLGGIKFG